MLKITDLHKSFGGVQALDGVSLDIGQAQVVAIVGDNGAGKSTLMKCVSGMHQADTGRITFNNQDVTNDTPSQSRAIGIEMIYQDLGLCGQQDVVTNVFLGKEEKKGLFLDKVGMAGKCAKAFKELGIDIPLNTATKTLSGGQQQSVAIARAIISNPKLLITDEPTAALAVKEVNKVLKHIKVLKKKGISVVMITHRLSDIFEVADRIVVMRRGKIIHDLLPKETNLQDLTCKIIV